MKAFIEWLPQSTVPILLVVAACSQIVGTWCLVKFATVGIDWADANTEKFRKWGFRLQLAGFIVDLIAGLIWFQMPARFG